MVFRRECCHLDTLLINIALRVHFVTLTSACGLNSLPWGNLIYLLRDILALNNAQLLPTTSSDTLCHLSDTTSSNAAIIKSILSQLVKVRSHIRAL